MSEEEKITIPPAIARHSFIRRYPKNFDIQHIVDSTGPHEKQSHTEKIQKLKKYINKDTSHYLPQNVEKLVGNERKKHVRKEEGKRKKKNG